MAFEDFSKLARMGLRLNLGGGEIFVFLKGFKWARIGLRLLE